MAAPDLTVDIARVLELEVELDTPDVQVIAAGNIGPAGPPGPAGPAGPEGPPGQWAQYTRAEYDALADKDPNVLYVIIG